MAFTFTVLNDKEKIHSFELREMQYNNNGTIDFFSELYDTPIPFLKNMELDKLYDIEYDFRDGSHLLKNVICISIIYAKRKGIYSLTCIFKSGD